MDDGASSEAHRIDFESVALQYCDELYCAALRLTHSRAEGEDLVQEAMMRAWAFWGRFEPGTNARAWMHRILMNTFINRYRRRKREREILAEVQHHADRDPSWTADERPAAQPGIGDEVEAALASLPDEFRAVVLLVDLDELSYREVADTLGCPIGTVMSRLHRGRRALKRRLRHYASGEGYVREAA